MSNSENGGADLAGQLAAAKKELEDTRAAYAAQARKRAIDEQVGDAVDAETARLLIEHAIGGGDVKDIAGAVKAAADALRKGKPFLFRGGGQRPPSGISAARAPDASGDEELVRAAHEASAGDRRALMRYLRLRRG